MALLAGAHCAEAGANIHRAGWLYVARATDDVLRLPRGRPGEPAIFDLRANRGRRSSRAATGRDRSGTRASVRILRARHAAGSAPRMESRFRRSHARTATAGG